jgi:hypothetical protein
MIEVFFVKVFSVEPLGVEMVARSLAASTELFGISHRRSRRASLFCASSLQMYLNSEPFVWGRVHLPTKDELLSAQEIAKADWQIA